MTFLQRQFAMASWYTLLLSFTALVYLEAFSDPTQTPVFLFLHIIGLVVLWLLPNHPDDVAVGFTYSRPFTAVVVLLLSVLAVGMVSSICHPWNTEMLYELARSASLVVFFTTCTYFIVFVKNGLRQLTWALGLCSTVYLGIGIYEAVQLGSGFFDEALSYEIKAHLGHRNLMANFIALSLPVYGYLILVSGNKWVKLVAGAALLTAMAFLILLASRVGWLGLAGFIVAGVGWLFLGKRFTLTKSTWIYLLVGISVLILISGLVFSDKHLSLNARKKAVSILTLGSKNDQSAATISERMVLWEKTARLCQQHLWLGVGPGQWQFNFPAMGLDGTQAHNGKVLFQRPHNDMLWYFSEYGLFGWMAFLCLVGYVVAYSLKKLGSDQGKEALLAGTGVGIWVLVGLVDFPKERPVHLFYFGFYLAVFATQIRGKSSIHALEFLSRIWMNKGVRLMSILLCVYMGVRLAGEFHLNKALANRVMGRYDEMDMELNKAESMLMNYDLTGTPFQFYRGEAQVYRRNINAGIQRFEEALAKNRYHLYVLSNMGSCYWMLGQKELALTYWDQALAISPDFGEARINKSIALFQSGQLKAAANTLKFKMDSEDLIAYQKQVVIIYGSYIKEIALQVREPLLYEKLMSIVVKDAWIETIYAQMIKGNRSPGYAALQNALWSLRDQDKKISREKYDQWLRDYTSIFN